MPTPICTRWPEVPALSEAPMPAKLRLPDSAYSRAMPNSRKALPAAESTMYLMPASSERRLKKA